MPDLSLYQCCFCGEDVVESDRAAVYLAVANLWSDIGATAVLFAHSACMAEVVSPELEGEFDPETLQPPN